VGFAERRLKKPQKPQTMTTTSPTGGARRRVKSLDDIWPDLEAGLTQLFTNLNEGKEEGERRKSGENAI